MDIDLFLFLTNNVTNIGGEKVGILEGRWMHLISTRGERFRTMERPTGLDRSRKGGGTSGFRLILSWRGDAFRRGA